MTIDYDEWSKREYEKFLEFTNLALDMIEKKGTFNILDLVPELGIECGQPYTIWIPPGRPENLNKP